MNVKEFIEKYELEVFCEGDLEREITGGYCGDLLSWVMGRAKEGDAWMTVMNNINIVAVACLADVACIVVTENSQPDEAVKEAAEKNEITILKTERTTYEMAVLCSEIL